MSIARPCVLVVDDDADDALLLSEFLEEHGYRAVACDDWEAFDLAIKLQPAIILCDLLMPRVDGASLCRRLRADARTKQLPIGIVTGAPLELLGNLLLGCAPDAVVPKLWDESALLATLTRLAARE